MPLRAKRGSKFQEIAAIYASVKFGLLLLGVFYALVGWLWPKKTM